MKLVIKIIKKSKIPEKSKTIIYLKRINRKFDKYIKDKKVKNIKYFRNVSQRNQKKKRNFKLKGFKRIKSLGSTFESLFPIFIS